MGKISREDRIVMKALGVTTYEWKKLELMPLSEKIVSQRWSRADRQTTCDRQTALCTIVHRAVKIIQFYLCIHFLQAKV